MPNSTIRPTERWDARVGQWVALTAPAPMPVAVPAVQAPAAAAPDAPAARTVIVRAYSNARRSRLTTGFGSSSNSSADAELSSSLAELRSRSRQMIRDSAYAKRAQAVVVNNVIGAGIGMQAQVTSSRDNLRENVNAAIEQAWSEWCEADSCHTAGQMHFADFERAAMGQVFEAGEVFIRKHLSPFGGSRIPLALELVEAERLADDIAAPAATAPDARTRLGVEIDRFGRPLAYWIRQGHPGDLRPIIDSDRYERVPADQVFHLRLIVRSPQTRGEPWLHTVLRKLDDMNEYSAAEVQAARASSYYFGTIKSPAPDNVLATTESDGVNPPQMDIESGMIQQLVPGEELDFHSPNRPNAALDPFLRYMLREVAAGAGPSYESISRDYSQSNYSSSRLGVIDERDTWRILQQWWVRSFRQPLHRLWLQQAVIGRAIAELGMEYALDPRKFEAVVWKPRGWTWIDPGKDVDSRIKAVRAGFDTVTNVISETGNGLDIEDVMKTRRRELQMFEDNDIEVSTNPADFDDSGKPVSEPADTGAGAGDGAPNGGAPPDGNAADGAQSNQKTTRPARVVSFRG